MPYPDPAQFGNLSELDAMYQRYRKDPESVEPTWNTFFQGFDLGTTVAPAATGGGNLQIWQLIQAYRSFGHLAAPINPLKEVTTPARLSIESFGFSSTDLQKSFFSFGLCEKEEATLAEIVDRLRSIYSSRIGFEYMGLGNPDIERWFQSKIEPRLNVTLREEEKKMLFEQLIETEALESFIHTRYVGQKRFSIEGGETLLPMIVEILETLAGMGCKEMVIGMAHRGRLNVLANVLQKPYSMIFKEFEEGLSPFDFEGSGDVKYHKGYSKDRTVRGDQTIHVHLAANSSCLESVDPIALGLARAKQKKQETAALLIHGDASLAGQGVVYESLQFMRLPGYGTGGTMHIVVNNQIGFTTPPSQSRSTTYCTDIAKTFSVPVFHVNAEDPESCVYAARLAAEFRAQFQSDVFLDLVSYRKYGHNEGDEPAYTQPTEYKLIRSKKSIIELYQEKMGISQEVKETIAQKCKERLSQAYDQAKKEPSYTAEELHGTIWGAFKQPTNKALFDPVNTKVAAKDLELVAKEFCSVPTEFHLHPKLQRFLQDRLAMGAGQQPIDWGMAECLAFGTLLMQKTPIRLSGQDSQRGTFSQRHAVWTDEENGSLYTPFSKLGSFEVYNSPLSEFAVLGFEYGHSWGSLQALTIWEAQYGDFSIGAQTIIDHYIMAAEQKWTRYSNLILLLPHGYEGAGPEHSSARMERFLQLAALNNTQIVNCTTPAQYFHVLRRQALFSIKKPLILFTPKSLLRLPACTSKREELVEGAFQEFLPDKQSKRAILCTGKVYYDLVGERKKRGKEEIAIHRIEQLYPVHEEKLRALLQGVEDLRWVQEEPENMGAWEFLAPYLQKVAPVRYVGRPRSGATATGSSVKHKKELEQFMNEAFS